MRTQGAFRGPVVRRLLVLFSLSSLVHVFHVSGAHGLMSLFPTEEEAVTFTNLDELRRWYGLRDPEWQAFHLQVGEPDLRIFSALPPEALIEQILLTRAGTPPVSLTPAHAVQIGLVWRLANRISFVRGGGSYAAWRDIDPWARQTPAAPTVPTLMAPPLKERGIKMSSVIDQSDDSEFIPEPLARADAWYQRYLSVMGGAPQEEEDCTVEQLSALNKRVHTLDLPPYVDLGVWQPYGRRALRANKFRAWFPDGAGGYIARELPGPSSWSQWLAAWRVFQTAAIMLDILPLATLQLYERHVERLVKLYPTAWHLIVMADEKARGEKWARVRLKISADLASGKGAPELWDPRKPWIAALHKLVNDTGFWEDQVRSPANAWVAAGGRGAPKNPEEAFSSSLGTASTDPPEAGSPSKRTTKEKRLAKKRKIQAEKEELKAFRSASGHPKGKGDGGKGDTKLGNLKAKDQAGDDLCFGWDSSRGPCADAAPGEPCRGKVKRVHKCRVCLSPGHRSTDCPQRA